MQIVETYCGMYIAKSKMKELIEDGWRIHTCTMCSSGSFESVLVVYEK